MNKNKKEKQNETAITAIALALQMWSSALQMFNAILISGQMKHGKYLYFTNSDICLVAVVVGGFRLAIVCFQNGKRHSSKQKFTRNQT